MPFVSNIKKSFDYANYVNIGQKPKNYKMIDVECCQTCRFVEFDYEGILKCKLCVDYLDFNFGFWNLVEVDNLGKCDRYKHRREKHGHENHEP